MQMVNTRAPIGFQFDVDTLQYECTVGRKMKSENCRSCGLLHSMQW